MRIFDGIAAAATLEQQLTTQVIGLKRAGIAVSVAALYYTEDPGSRLYTAIKQETARRIGIEYQAVSHSITEPLSVLQESIQALCAQPVTGVIIQKPTRRVWEEFASSQATTDFSHWWSQLTSALDPAKDVDGLHSQTHAAIAAGTWQEQGKVLPATCSAVYSIISQEVPALQHAKVLIVGKSDLLGIPLYNVLRSTGITVELLRKVDLEARERDGRRLLDGTVIVSATGVPGLIKAEMITPGAVVIDVGEPRGDVDTSAVAQKAELVTPVPGGVGPLTVMHLLKNAITLSENSKLALFSRL